MTKTQFIFCKLQPNVTDLYTRIYLVNNSTRISLVNNSTRISLVNNSTRINLVNNSTRISLVNNSTRISLVNNFTRVNSVNNSTRISIRRPKDWIPSRAHSAGGSRYNSTKNGLIVIKRDLWPNLNNLSGGLNLSRGLIIVGST